MRIFSSGENLRRLGGGTEIVSIGQYQRNNDDADRDDQGRGDPGCVVAAVGLTAIARSGLLVLSIRPHPRSCFLSSGVT